jgi:hypothetical protein
VLDAPLTPNWPGIADASLEPQRVRITVHLERSTALVTIQRIPLLIPLLVEEVGEVEVKLAEGDRLQQIDVRAPQAKLALLRDLESSQVMAFVLVQSADLPPVTSTNPADLEGVRLTKRVRFYLPPGFEDVEIVSPERLVNLTVRRKPEVSALPVSPVSP